MSLKYIHSTFFIVVVMFSVVYDRKINKQPTELDLRNDSENKDLYYDNSKQKERDGRRKEKEEIFTSRSSRSGKIVKSPLFFSDRSGRDSASVETVHRKHNDNIDTINAMSHKYVKSHGARQESELAAKNSLFLKKHLKVVTESNREVGEDRDEKVVVNEKRNNENDDTISTMTGEYLPWSKSHLETDLAKKHATFLEKHLSTVTEPNKEKGSDFDERVSVKRTNDNIKSMPGISNEYVKGSKKELTAPSKGMVTIRNTPSPRHKKPRKNYHNKKNAATPESSRKPTELITQSAKLDTILDSTVDNKTKTLFSHDENQSEDEQIIQSEVLKADYLRQAYIDACKVVIIRKCRRALRAVSKDVCSRGRSCNKKFKDTFRHNGMEACDKQYINQTSACRSGVVDDTNESIKARRVFTVAKDIKETNTSKQLQKTKKINILRDRYEKACKKDSYKKCIVACKDASDKTCKHLECIASKKRAFKKSCKKRCKEIFKITGKDSQSDEDDDDDDDDDDGDGGDALSSGSN